MRGLVGSSRLLSSPPLYDFFFCFGKTPSFLPESYEDFFFFYFVRIREKKRNGAENKKYNGVFPNKRPPTLRHNSPPTSPSKKKSTIKKKVRRVTFFSQPWFGGTAPSQWSSPRTAAGPLIFFFFLTHTQTSRARAGLTSRREDRSAYREQVSHGSVRWCRRGQHEFLSFFIKREREIAGLVERER